MMKTHIYNNYWEGNEWTYLDKVPQWISAFLDNVSMVHAVAGDVPLPVDGVEVLILTDAGDLVGIACNTGCILNIVGENWNRYLDFF